MIIYKNGTNSKVKLLEDTDEEVKMMKSTKIEGFDERLLQKQPLHLEPYAVLQIMSYIYDAVTELKKIQEKHGGGEKCVIGYRKNTGCHY